MNSLINSLAAINIKMIIVINKILVKKAEENNLVLRKLEFPIAKYLNNALSSPRFKIGFKKRLIIPKSA